MICLRWKKNAKQRIWKKMRWIRRWNNATQKQIAMPDREDNPYSSTSRVFKFWSFPKADQALKIWFYQKS